MGFRKRMQADDLPMLFEAIIKVKFDSSGWSYLGKLLRQ